MTAEVFANLPQFTHRFGQFGIAFGLCAEGVDIVTHVFHQRVEFIDQFGHLIGLLLRHGHIEVGFQTSCCLQLASEAVSLIELSELPVQHLLGGGVHQIVPVKADTADGQSDECAEKDHFGQFAAALDGLW